MRTQCQGRRMSESSLRRILTTSLLRLSEEIPFLEMTVIRKDNVRCAHQNKRDSLSKERTA